MKSMKNCTLTIPDDVPPIKKMEITLPGHLAWWLEQFAERIAMKPDQLIANILEYYYETWRLGYEKACTDH